MTLRQKLFYAFSGFVIGNALLAALVVGFYFYSQHSPTEIELTFDTAMSRINSPELKGVRFNNEKAIFKQEDHEEVFSISTDAQRELLLKKIDERNINSPVNAVKVEESAESTGHFMTLVPIIGIIIGISQPLIVILLIVLLLRKNSNKNLT
jgi:ATP-dependent Zn protease